MKILLGPKPGIALGLLASLALLACPSSPPPRVEPPRPAEDAPLASAEDARPPTAPRRVILFVGDGMGVAALSGAHYAKGSPLHMAQLPHVSFMRTHEHEFLTTDSAASATAFATGQKTHFEAVSVTPGTTREQETDPGRHMMTMVEHARALGLRTGLVATSRINHATPAAFAAHRHHRGSYEDIALDMSRAGVDVLLGAGYAYFNARKDGQDLLAAMREQGYTVALDAPSVEAAAKTSRKVVGLMHPKDMPPLSKGGRAMSLAQMTQHALTILDRDNPQGFFLMVEGSQIDWEEHAMDGPATLLETLDLDEAVGVARRYAADRSDTLIVVTADHETGGLAILDPPSAQPYVKAFGSWQQANEAVATTYPGASAPVPDALASVPLGDPKAQGMTQLGPAAQLVTTFGHLSVASRKHWTKDDSFIATHTNVMVPLLAQGLGAQQIAQIEDNADLGQALMGLLTRAAREQAQPGAGEPAQRASLGDAQARPKNIILMIGDGMGLPAITAAFYTRGSLQMLNAPVKGLVSTHGVDRLVNDSAATATALATGQRTRYGAVGMVVDDRGSLVSAPSLLELAESRGMRTGLVTTTTVTHATPAAFYAHVPQRKDEAAIAGFLVDLPSRVAGSDGLDVVLGGGASFFSAAQLDALRARGVTVERAASQTPIQGQWLGLYADKALDPASTRLALDAQGQPKGPTLAQLTSRALDALASSPAGFVLVVEGGQIDWRLHELTQGPALIDEVMELDEAVGVAMRFARERQDTLVVVTADHDHTLSLLDNHYGFSKGQCQIAKECGGQVPMTRIPLSADPSARRGGFRDEALQGASGAPALILQYAWVVQAAARMPGGPKAGPHSAHWVPLMAYGPQAQTLGGVLDQPIVGRRLMELLAAPK